MLAGAVEFAKSVAVTHGGSFGFEAPAVSGTGVCEVAATLGGRTPRGGKGRARESGLSPDSGRSSALVQALGRPVLEPGAERQAAGSQHFLDFIERLATQVRRLQQLGLGALDQVADVVDVL
eukprot:gene39770-53779_t